MLGDSAKISPLSLDASSADQSTGLRKRNTQEASSHVHKDVASAEQKLATEQAAAADTDVDTDRHEDNPSCAPKLTTRQQWKFDRGWQSNIAEVLRPRLGSYQRGDDQDNTDVETEDKIDKNKSTNNQKASGAQGSSEQQASTKKLR